MLVAATELLLHPLAHVLEDERVGIGRNRELMFVVGDAKGTVGVLDPELAILEDLAVLIAERRHHQLELILGLATRRPPVDVEEASVGRRGAVLQHVDPAVIARIADAHVVGHDVD